MQYAEKLEQYLYYEFNNNTLQSHESAYKYYNDYDTLQFTHLLCNNTCYSLVISQLKIRDKYFLRIITIFGTIWTMVSSKVRKHPTNFKKLSMGFFKWIIIILPVSWWWCEMLWK